MTFDCERLKGLLTGFSLVKDCYQLKDGTLRVATALRYPNGSYVDVFVHGDGDLCDTGPGFLKGFVLSDLGQTAMYLVDLGMEIWGTEKRRHAVEDVCSSLDVQNYRSQLQVKCYPDQEELVADAFVRLAQACIRVADLSYMQRFAAPTVFREEVEDFLVGTHLRFEPNIVLSGKHQNEVPVDYRVVARRTSLLRLLSGKTMSSIHGTANEIFRCWYDLAELRGSNQFVTLVDSRNKAAEIRGDDASRLAEFSKVIYFPIQERTLLETLSA